MGTDLPAPFENSPYQGPFGRFIGDPEEWPNPNAELAMEEITPARPDIEGDAAVINQTIFDRIAERAPGWIARDGDLTVWIVEEFSTVAAEIRNEAMTVPEAVFQTYGTEVLGIPIALAQSAVGTSDWTATTTRGYVIPVGTQISLARTGDELVAFETTEEARIEPDTDTVTGVPIRAVNAGEAGNGLHGEADVMDPLAWVDTIEVAVPTHDGADGQTVEQYLTELILLMRLIALRPILPWDFAVLAMRIPGVARAVAMDGFNAPDQTWGHARMITLIVTDENGEPCSNVTMQAVRDYLESLREVNWICWVVAPEREVIDVAMTVTAFSEQDPLVVELAVTEALHDELLPANFRLGTAGPGVHAGEVIPPPPPYGPGGPTRQTIRLNDLVALADRQRGVDFVNYASVTINGQAADYTMPGPTYLPYPGTITVTVETQ
jgi:hypothetical protein